jgi:hypothetical protein
MTVSEPRPTCAESFQSPAIEETFAARSSYGTDQKTLAAYVALPAEVGACEPGPVDCSLSLHHAQL